MRIGVSLAAMVFAGMVMGLAAARLPQPARQVRDIDRVVLVARADAELPDVAHSLGGARTVDSVAALDANLDAEMRVVVIDRSAVLDAPSGSLRGLYLRGMPLMAINASVADLYRLTGQDQELGAIDSQLAVDTLARLTCEGECAQNTFWSLTWRSCSGDLSGSSMGPYVGGHTSAREFNAQLVRQLRLGPPCSEAREQANTN